MHRLRRRAFAATDGDGSLSVWVRAPRPADRYPRHRRHRTISALPKRWQAHAPRSGRAGHDGAPFGKVSTARTAHVPRMGRPVLCHSVYTARTERSSRPSPIRAMPRREARVTVMRIQRRTRDDAPPTTRLRRRAPPTRTRRGTHDRRPLGSARHPWSRAWPWTPRGHLTAFKHPAMPLASRSPRCAQAIAPAPPRIRCRGTP
jgi:hypothetical protein